MLLLRTLSAILLSLSVVTAQAAPAFFTTHNNTDEESNAYISGTVPSPYPTPPHSFRQVYWNMVRMACYGHITAGQCKAVIKVGTNTDSPIEIGTVSLDLDTGDITPKYLENNGYNVVINGPGEATVNKN